MLRRPQKILMKIFIVGILKNRQVKEDYINKKTAVIVKFRCLKILINKNY